MRVVTFPLFRAVLTHHMLCVNLKTLFLNRVAFSMKLTELYTVLVAGADIGYSKRGVETRDTKSGGGGGGGGGGVLSASGTMRKVGVGGWGGGGCLAKRGRYLI